MNFHLSYTRCKTSACGFRFQHEQAADADQTEPNDFASLGIALHVVAAQLAFHCQREDRVSDAGYCRHLVNKLLEQPHWDDFAREHLLITGDRLAQSFTLPRDYQKPLVIEQRLAVDRDYQPIAVGTDVDRFEGTPDLAWIATGGKTGGLVDWKCGPGPPQLDYSEAKHDRQLLAYSALMFLHNPDLEYISARKNFVRWAKGEQSPWDWGREHCLEEFRLWVDSEWQMIDSHRELYGDGPWPATPRADTCENYCNLTAICPAYRELLSTLETMPTSRPKLDRKSVSFGLGRGKRTTTRRRR